MAVTNDTSFSLQDVINEIAGSQDDLIECFAGAISAGFNSSYSGSKNSLLNFRDYDDSAGGTATTNTTYYQMSGCTTSAGWTTVFPTSGTGQRYIDPSTTTYYTYSGNTTTATTAPSGFIGSIQIVAGQVGCP